MTQKCGTHLSLEGSQGFIILPSLGSTKGIGDLVLVRVPNGDVRVVRHHILVHKLRRIHFSRLNDVLRNTAKIYVYIYCISLLYFRTMITGPVKLLLYLPVHDCVSTHTRTHTHETTARAKNSCTNRYAHTNTHTGKLIR
jgi:hypothetical protein